MVCLCKPGKQKLAEQPYGARERQLLRATALRLRCSLWGYGDLDGAEPEDDAYALFQDPHSGDLDEGRRRAGDSTDGRQQDSEVLAVLAWH